MGHRTPTNDDAGWAANDPSLRLVYADTSENEMDHVARAFIRDYDHRGPLDSYFDGVSVGGREALDLAQRYPDDFNGIVAGAPADNLAALFGSTRCTRSRCAPPRSRSPPSAPCSRGCT